MNVCEILPGLSIGHLSTNSVERPFLAEHISAKESEYVFQDQHSTVHLSNVHGKSIKVNLM